VAHSPRLRALRSGFIGFHASRELQSLIDKIFATHYSSNIRENETKSSFSAAKGIHGSFIQLRLLSLPLLSEPRRAGVLIGLRFRPQRIEAPITHPQTAWWAF
jgi:hypothetical protein